MLRLEWDNLRKHYYTKHINSSQNVLWYVSYSASAIKLDQKLPLYKIAEDKDLQSFGTPYSIQPSIFKS
jgi:sialic acid synthase SpsE